MKTTERTVILNSRFRANRRDTSTNFNILLNKAVSVDDVDRIIVKRVSIPNLFFNVPARKNKLYLDYEGTPLILDLDPGQYDSEQFRAGLENMLQGVDGTATVFFDQSTAKYTLNLVGPFVLGWTLLSHADVKERHGVDESLNDILGTSYDETLPAAATWTSPNAADLSGEHTVRIESGKLAHANSFDSRGHIINTLDVVPITEGYGSIVHYQPRDHILSFIDSGNIGRSMSNVDIQLVSNSGQPLDLPDNAYVEIVLLILFRHTSF